MFVLGAVGKCQGYVPAYYQAFLNEVPKDQHYAVNYLHWGLDKPLLSAAEARAMEAQDFPRMAQLPDAPAIPGGADWTPTGGTGASVAGDVGAALGACGLPVSDAPAAEQDIYARHGTCAQLTGEPAAAAPARTAETAPAPAGPLGACGVPPLDDYDRYAQQAAKDEGDCDAYREEAEAEGF